MAQASEAQLRYPDTPATRARVRVAGVSQQVKVILAKPGEPYDICMPTDDPFVAQGMFEQLSELALDPAIPSQRDVLVGGLGKATGGGEFYLKQVEVAGKRFSKTAQSVADDFAKYGKYTSAHASTILEARRVLTSSLKDVFPGISFYRIAPSIDMLDSSLATLRLASDVNAMTTLKGRPFDNLVRNAPRRGNAAPTYLAETPVLIDSKLARALKVADKFMVAVEIAPAVGDFMTASSEQEQRKAALAMSAKATGMLLDRQVSSWGMALCVGFGVSTAGWGFLVCGVAAMSAGIGIGYYAENKMKELIKIEDPPAPLPLPLP